VAFTDYDNSLKATVMMLVSGKIVTTTAVVSNLNPAGAGQNITFTATVSPSAATGTVTFKDGATTLGTGTLSGGTATYSTSSIPAGNHDISAVYPGDSIYRHSTSSTLAQGVFPTLTPPVTENVGAGLATLVLQSSGTGTGYFTLLNGSGASCGTGDYVKNGQTGDGPAAPYHGSLPLTADTAARYTIRNLTQSTAYTVCFTADSPSGANLNPTPVSTIFTTPAITAFTNPAWSPVGSAGFSAGQADISSLVIAADGTPYLAFGANVMKYNGATWEYVGFPGSFSGQVALALAPDGTPYVAFKDGAFGGGLMVMKFNGASWDSVGSTSFLPFPPSEANNISLVLPRTGPRMWRMRN
jgi:hypothetical protein